MLEKFIRLCDEANVKFELSTWYALLEGKNRIVLYGVGSTFVELYDSSIEKLLEAATEKIEENRRNN